MTTKNAPRTALAEKPITPLMKDFAAYILDQTGYVVDERTLQLGGTMRAEYQKSAGRQAANAEAATRKAADEKARADRKAAAAKKVEKVVAKKPVARRVVAVDKGNN